MDENILVSDFIQADPFALENGAIFFYRIFPTPEAHFRRAIFFLWMFSKHPLARPDYLTEVENWDIDQIIELTNVFDLPQLLYSFYLHYNPEKADIEHILTLTQRYRNHDQVLLSRLFSRYIYPISDDYPLFG